MFVWVVSNLPSLPLNLVRFRQSEQLGWGWGKCVKVTRFVDWTIPRWGQSLSLIYIFEINKMTNTKILLLHMCVLCIHPLHAYLFIIWWCIHNDLGLYMNVGQFVSSPACWVTVFRLLSLAALLIRIILFISQWCTRCVSVFFFTTGSHCVVSCCWESKHSTLSLTHSHAQKCNQYSNNPHIHVRAWQLIQKHIFPASINHFAAAFKLLPT